MKTQNSSNFQYVKNGLIKNITSTRILFFLSLFLFNSPSWGQNQSQTQWQRFDQSQKMKQVDFIESIKAETGISISKDNLKLRRAIKGKNEILHNAFQQTERDIPIENAYLTYHSIHNNIFAGSNSLIDGNKLPSSSAAQLNKEQAIQQAISIAGASKYSWEDQEFETILKEINKDPNYSSYPKPELCFFNPKYSGKVEDYVLAYKIDIYSLQPQNRHIYYLDANDGSLLHTLDVFHHNCTSGTPATSTASTLYYGSQSLDVKSESGQFELVDCDRDIETYIMPGGTNQQTTGSIGSDNNLNFTNFNTPEEQAALSVHWATGLTYDFFLDLGIESFNDQGALIRSYVNYGDEYSDRNNAFWNGSFLTYGAGPLNGESGTFTGQIASTDVVAHEFGHAITQYLSLSGGVIYQGESGAINESYSDIIGAAVDNYILTLGSVPIDPWLIGESVTASGLRSMSNPSQFGQPDTYGAGPDWADPSDLSYDHGGVHINSGVMNYWFYLIAVGDSGTNDVNEVYDVTGIGIDDAFAIVLESYNFLTTNNPTFADMREATILASETLFGCQYSEVLVEAWDAVNVGIGEISGDCILLAAIDNPTTQLCVGESAEYFSTNINPDFLEEWLVDDNLVSNPITFPTAGEFKVTLRITDTNPGSTTFGDVATDEITVFVVACEPILDERGTMYFGRGVGFDFSSGLAELITHPFGFFESNICQADENGNVLFYISRNGDVDLFDGNHNSLTGGVGLAPMGDSGRQIGGAMPSPDGQFYNIIMNTSHQSIGGSSLYRLIVEVNNNVASFISFDPVIPPEDDNNTTFTTNQEGALRVHDNVAMVPHACDENKFWVVITTNSPKHTLMYELDYTGGGAGTFEYHHTESQSAYTTSGTFEFSPNGDRVVTRRQIRSFDRLNGDIGNFGEFLQVPYFLYQSVFSKSGRFLYAINFEGEIIQFDTHFANVEDSETVIATIPDVDVLTGLADFILGPDNRIYFIYHTISNPPTKIGVINHPDVSATLGNVGVNLDVYDVPNLQVFHTFPEYMKAPIPPPNSLYFTVDQTGCFEIEVDAAPCFSEYTWDFGDGSDEETVIENIYTHTFPSPGVYTITLSVQSNGSTISTTEEITITGFEGINDLSITGPEDFCDDGFGFYIAPPGYEYSWTVVGDATNITDQSAQSIWITWGSDETYTIEVELTDQNGCTGTISMQVEKDPTCCEIPFVCRSRNKSLGINWFDNLDCAYDVCEGENVQLMIRPINGPLSNYTFEWSGGTVNAPHIITPDGAGYYTVTITDDSGCVQEASFLYEENCCGIPNYCRIKNNTQNIDWTDDADCLYEACDQDDVRIMIRPENGPVSDYNYAWSGGTPNTNSPHVITPDGAGTYTVTITSPGGCEEVKSFTYETECCGIPNYCRVRNLSNGTKWVDDPDCYYNACDEDDILIMIRPTNGSPSDYTYNWSGGLPDINSPHILTPDGPGIYTVTITSSGGCTEVSSFTYETECCEIPVDCRVKNFTQAMNWTDDDDCLYEACDQDVVNLMIRPSNGNTSDYTYEWSGGTPNANSPHIITPDGPGIYTVTITTSSGCTQVSSITYETECCGIPNYCQVKNNTQDIGWTVDNDCLYEACDQDDVRIMIRPTNAPVDNYTYAWSAGTPDGNSPHIITPNGDGIYTVTITSDGGCTEVSSFTYETKCCVIPYLCRVKNNTQGIEWTDDDDCSYEACDQDDVRIMIRPENGPTTNYSYAWSGGTQNVNSPHVITPDGPGIYTVTITSNTNLGCTEVATFDYQEDPPIQFACKYKNFTQGTAYLDAEDCTYTSCEGDNVHIFMSTGGFSSTWTWEWSAGTPTGSPQSQVITDGPGDYTLTITKANGCQYSETFTLYEDEEITPICRIKNTTEGIDWTDDSDCFYQACEDDNVKLMIRPSNGPASNYTYNWSGGTPNVNSPHIITPNGSGTYTVTITSEAGCSVESSITYETECCGFSTLCRVRNITQNIPWTDDEDCEVVACQDDDVRLMIRPVNGPVDSYTYVWSAGTQSTNSPHIITPDGTTSFYTVTITSSGGCEETATITYFEEGSFDMPCRYNNITQGTGWVDAFNCDYFACEGDEVLIEIGGSTSSSNSTYEWSAGIPSADPQTQVTATGPGDYTLTVTSQNGCVNTKTFTLFEESCCEDVDLINPDYSVLLEIRDLDAAGCYVTLAAPINDLFDFCDDIICCPTGIDSYSGTYTIWSNGVQSASGGFTSSQSGVWCTTGGGYKPFSGVTSALNICDGHSKTEPGDVITATFSITDIASECELNITSFTLTPEPLTLTLEDINACCEDPEVLECSYNNITEGTNWVDSPDCSATACIGDEVQIQITTANTPDPSWTWEWSAGTLTATPYIIIANGPGDYTVTLTDGNGNTNIKTFTLIDAMCCEEFNFVCAYQNVTQGLEYEESPNCSYTSCIGDQVNILMTPNNVSFNEDWIWTWSAGTPTDQPFIVTSTGAGEYTVTLTSPEGCSSSSTFTLTEEMCCNSCYCSNGNESIDPDPSDNTGVLLSQLIADGIIVLNGNLYEGYECFSVVGQLDIDVPIEIGEGTFNMFPGSKIVVKSGVSVEIDDAIFKGCDAECAQMWHGFEVEAGASLNINTVTIQDAQFGINLIGASTASVINSFLYDNFIGVYHLGTNSAANDPTLTFHGNLVSGTGNLKAPFEGQFTHPELIDIPYAGLFINKDGVVDIGSDDAQAGTNTFSDLHNGIIANSGAITCRNNSFTDIFEAPQGALLNPFTDSGFGILVSGDQNMQHYLDQEGLGSVQPSFENCATAISVENCGIEARNNKMENVGIGIATADNDATHNPSTLIYDNTIFSSETAISLVGEFSPIGNGGNPGYIADNTIIHNSNVPSSKAIVVEDIYGTDGFSIYDNTITLGSDGSGLFIKDCSDLLVQDNIFKFESSLTSGLGIQSSTGISAISNQFLGCSDAATGTCDLGFKKGISTLFGDDYYFECNEFDDLRIGISVLSPCLDMTVDVRNNTFSNYCTGIKYDFCGTGSCTDNTNVIDFGGSANNRWLTPPICTDFGDPAAAYFEGSCFSNDPPVVFQVSDEYVNVDPYYPIDHLLPPSEEFWFASTTEDLPDPCPIPEPFCCACDENGINIGLGVDQDVLLSELIGDEIILDANNDLTGFGCLAITGRLIIDIDTNVDDEFAIIGGTVNMQPGAEIVVPDGVKLRLVDTHIKGCETGASPECAQMWRGITIQPDGKIEVLGNVNSPTIIEDAQYGIYVQSNTNSDGDADNTETKLDMVEFTNNHIGFYVEKVDPSCTGCVNNIDMEPFRACTFQTVGTMLPNYDSNLTNFNDQNGYAGMIFYDVQQTTLIGLDEIGAESYYTNLRNGIIMDNSNIWSLYNVLNNIVGTPPTIPSVDDSEGIGVLILNGSKSRIFDNKISQVYTGIHCISSENLLEKNTIHNGIVVGIQVDEIHNQFTKIEDSKIEYLFRGIALTEIGSLTNGAHVHIINNELTRPAIIDSWYGLNGLIRGISAEGDGSFANLNLNGQIKDNTVKMYVESSGIIATANDGWMIGNNNIFFYTPLVDNSNIDSHIGIGLNYVSQSTINDGNAVHYIKPDGSDELLNVTAYRFIESNNNTICGNLANNTFQGFTFFGDCGSTAFTCNTMKNHHVSLLLDEARIGNQLHGGNLWDEGSAFTSTATFIGATYGVSESQFVVEGLPNSSEFWPDVINEPTTWFIADANGSSSCSSEGECATIDCEDLILTCKYNNITQGTGFITTPDCSYTACEGDEVQIQIKPNGSSNFDWTWEWSGGTPTAEQSKIIATGPGDYTLSLTDANGCLHIQTFTLSEEFCCTEDIALTCNYRNITQPTGWVESEDCTYTSCIGDDVNIFIYPTSGSCTGCTFEWSAGIPTSGPFTIETEGAGDYTVTVTDLNGCTGVATFTLFEEDCCVLLDCEIKNNTQNIDWVTIEDCEATVCQGDDVWLQVYPPYIPPSDWTWTWSAGTPLTNFPYVIIPDGSGDYTVTVTDSENCETVKTFTLNEEDELWDPNPQSEVVIQNFNDNGCYLFFGLTDNYLFNFCDYLECCPTGVSSFKYQSFTFSNGVQIAQSNPIFQVSNPGEFYCSFFISQFASVFDNINVCTNNFAPGDVITIEFQVTEISSDCDFGFTELNLVTDPLVLTESNINGCCDALPPSMNDELNNQEFTFDLNLDNGIEESPQSIENKSFKVYPNPFKESFILDISTGQAEDFEFNMFDKNGRLVKSQKGVLHQGGNQIEINELDNLIPGIYIYRVQTSTELVSEKIFKFE